MTPQLIKLIVKASSKMANGKETKVIKKVFISNSKLIDVLRCREDDLFTFL